MGGPSNSAQQRGQKQTDERVVGLAEALVLFWGEAGGGHVGLLREARSPRVAGAVGVLLGLRKGLVTWWGRGVFSRRVGEWRVGIRATSMASVTWRF